MEQRILTAQQVQAFAAYLTAEEKSPATIEKYLRDVRAFAAFAGADPVDKDRVMAYKNHLIQQGYAVRSINSMLASLNSLLAFLGWQNCRVRTLRQQKQTFCAAEKELTKAEYQRLLQAARHSPQLQLVMQTICATGIRVSELRHFTAESAAAGQVQIRSKGKVRTVFIPGKLRVQLMAFAKRQGIVRGVIFRARNGKPLSRCAIWLQMKRLCQAAGVAQSKVFPHNLRKLFARTFYGLEKDLAKLADILGHSSIDTTRIYIMSTGAEHRRRIERLGLVL